LRRIAHQGALGPLALLIFQSGVRKAFDLLINFFLVTLERQHVIGVGFQNLPGDLLLAAHGIERHDATGQFQHRQEFGHICDFIALVRHFQLAQ